MAGIIDFLPTADALLELSPEDLGMIVLHLVQKERTANVAVSNLEMSLWNANSAGYPAHKRMPVARAFAEAWQWLQTEGLLMVAPDQSNGFFCLTRKGVSIKSPADIETYRQGDLLPRGLLHPKLAEKVRPMFVRGDYAIAVLQSFIEVEIAVRAAAKLSNSEIGRRLMQAASNPENGPLTDREADKGERVGVMDLFCGAIGHCKNPPSHRESDFDRLSAARLITFASYLLAYVDGIESANAGGQ
jgi:uncharacterized protein (TIGR02391 family)